MSKVADGMTEAEVTGIIHAPALGVAVAGCACPIERSG
jgi:hypothetical protein